MVGGGATVPEDLCEGSAVLAGSCDVRGGFNLVVAVLGERGVEGPCGALEGFGASVVEAVSGEFTSQTSRNSAFA